jgi:hypothetical protein
MAGLGTDKAERYFASDFERLSSSSFDGIAAVSRRRRLAAQYCTRSVSTAMQYWIEQRLTKANYVKLPEYWFNRLKSNENALVLSFGSFIGSNNRWTD